MLKIVCAILFCAVVSVVTKADSVVLTSGTITGITVGVDNPFVINVSGSNFSLVNTGEPFIPNHLVPLPGESLTISGSVSPGFPTPFTTVTYNGVTYNTRVSGTLSFSPLVLTIPTDTNSTFIDGIPFTVGGELVFTQPDFTPLFSITFTGGGLARANLQYNPGFGRFVIPSIQYTFQPQAVPEPASLILLASGLSGSLWLRRRSRR